MQLHKNKICRCVEFSNPAAFLHEAEKPEQSKCEAKAKCQKPQEFFQNGDVGAHEALTMCFFCFYTIADGCAVSNDPEHMHVHWEVREGYYERTYHTPVLAHAHTDTDKHTTSGKRWCHLRFVLSPSSMTMETPQCGDEAGKHDASNRARTYHTLVLAHCSHRHRQAHNACSPYV